MTFRTKTKKKTKKITEMDSKINKLEQKLIEKNLEIRNINNDNMSATEVVKKIATKVNVNVCDNDIENAYRTKRNGKIFVEFSSLLIKRELKDQIKNTKEEVRIKALHQNIHFILCTRHSLHCTLNYYISH